ncbi:MAG: cysteine desulfurase family protein [Micrococcus sp.]|nr:cysteine desulfurase family protein [Micrococcus sp.]
MAPPNSARIYLDHAATTAPRPSALQAFVQASDGPANPASLHASGRAAKLRLEHAREVVAASLGAHPSEVIFTSGGTEADNLAILGLYRARQRPRPRPRILITGIEHHAVLDAAHWLVEREGAELVMIPVDDEGRVELEAWAAALADDSESIALATLMWANNEIGTVQPVRAAARLAAEAGVPVHTDAVQAVGALPVSFAESEAHTLAVSGHKLGAPVGVGALLVRRDAQLDPVQLGGGQERRLRSGTVAVALAAALATAVEEAVAEQPVETRRLRGLRDRLRDAVITVPGVEILGAWDPPEPDDAVRRLPGNLHLSLPGVSADALLFACDMAGLDTSSGSACTAGVAEPSHVVLALGRGDDAARSTQRFTLGHTTTAEEIERACALLPPLLDTLGRARRDRATATAPETMTTSSSTTTPTSAEGSRA